VDEFLIGIDVGGTNIKIMIMKKDLHIFAECSIKTRVESGYEVISDNMIRTIDSIFLDKHIHSPRILFIAMGIPGTVDYKNGITRELSKLKWNGFNPASKLGKYYSAPVRIDNDGNINALGEYYSRNLKNVNNLVLLTLGTGVGSGIILDGKIMRGSNSMGGELGHMTIMADGDDLCLCGRPGHFEAYCSGSALMNYTRKMMATNESTILHQYMKEEEYDNSMVTRGYKEKDPLCIQIINRYIRYLAVGCTNIMQILNPEVILLGGGISNASDILLPGVNEQCKKMVLNDSQYCPVEKASLGSRSGMYGACIMAATELGLV